MINWIKSILKSFKLKSFKKQKMTSEQEQIIDNEVVEIKKYLDEYREKVNKQNRERIHKNNNTCPNCKNTNEKEIVDKISQVVGEGKVEGEIYGNLFHTSGYVKGSSQTDTNAVNHCNKCGHQWKKEESNWQSSNDIIASKLKNIFRYCEQDEYSYLYKNDYENFKNYHLETIMLLTNDVWHFLPTYSRDEYTKGFFKSHFKSIIDN